MTHRTRWTLALRRLSAALSLTLPVVLAGLAAPASAAVLISQVYGGGGNTGAPYSNDFVELRNTGGSPVSLAGWSIQYASATGTSWTNSVNLSGSIPANGYYLVQLAAGATASGALPAPDATGGINMSGTAGKLALFNITTVFTGGTCPIGNAALVDFVGYGSTANCAEGGTPAPAPSNTLAVIRAASAFNCTDTNSNSVDFTAAAPLPRNSSTVIDCAGGGGTPPPPPPPPPPATTAAIYTIQGSGATSTMVGQTVSTSGVVTKLTNNGFFMQDLTGDGNPLTSDGIFVFTSTAPPANAQVGNLVQVTGTVAEFAQGSGIAATPLTQIGTVTAVDLLGTGYSITPTSVTLPLASGDSLERFEGMLVRIEGTLTVQQNYFQARFGQLTIGVGRHENPTNKHRPNTPQAIALAGLQARSRMLLDDGSSLQNVNPTPYFLANGVARAGDSVSNLVGVIDFGLATATATGPGLYRLQPTLAPSFTASNPRPAGFAGMYTDKLKLGSMNVLNFFTTFTNGQTASGQTGQGCSLGGSVSAANCRGADSLAEYLRQRDKIVRAITGLDADAVGLMEIQNNGNVAAQALVDALNSQTRASPWATVSLPLQSTGTDAIRVAIIYKPARLTPVGLPVSDADPVNNRPTLAQTFVTPAGDKFVLVVNHLKSKGSCPSGSGPDADSGDGQGCWNATRVQQAQQLRNFVTLLKASSGTDNVLLVGDFNAYGQEDPINTLTGDLAFVDQALRYNAFAYSYVFDGTAGRLDHAISTAEMSPKIVGTFHWHINADESLAYDYNLEFKQPACPTCAPDPANRYDAYRSSDHDPVLVLVDFTAPAKASATKPAATRAAVVR